MTAPLQDEALVAVLARAVHAAYVAHRIDAGDDPSDPSMRPFDELSNDQQAANRDAARHLPLTLARAGLKLADEPAEPPDAALERLAEAEHERWAQHKRSAGWRWGPDKDPVTKRTPDLVPYDQLPEAVKEYDRVVARALLAALVSIGRGVGPA